MTSGTEQGAKSNQTSRPPSEPIKAFPSGMVLKACPEINDYGPGGAVGSWRDLMSAAVVVRSMLGVSPSAYQDACEVMGSRMPRLLSPASSKGQGISTMPAATCVISRERRRAASFRSGRC